jgi:hypothetical protein
MGRRILRVTPEVLVFGLLDRQDVPGRMVKATGWPADGRIVAARFDHWIGAGMVEFVVESRQWADDELGSPLTVWAGPMYETTHGTTYGAFSDEPVIAGSLESVHAAVRGVHEG